MSPTEGHALSMGRRRSRRQEVWTVGAMVLGGPVWQEGQGG